MRQLDQWARRHREPSDVERGEHPVSAGLGRRQDLAAIEAIGLVTTLARRLIDGDLPPGVSERRARRVLLERKVEAFDLVAGRESGARAREARAQASAAWDELVSWHREDLEPRVTVDSVQDAGVEGYRFALDDRPVAELQFTAEGSDEDTDWFLWSIDAQAFEASPGAPLAWLGDPWPVDVAGVDVDALLQVGREQSREALLADARQVAQRTRAGALTAARAQLLAGLASDLAKGVRPFDAGGMAGSQRPTEQPSS